MNNAEIVIKSGPEPRQAVTARVTDKPKRNGRRNGLSNAERQAAFRERQKAKAWQPPEILFGECLQ